MADWFNSCWGGVEAAVLFGGCRDAKINVMLHLFSDSTLLSWLWERACV